MSDSFDFGQGQAFAEGPTTPGWYPVTLVEIKAPKPSAIKNDQGKNPLTSIFDFMFDPYEDDDGETVDNFSKWAYVNVEARGAGSNFNKVHMALMGAPVPTGPFPSGPLLGRRCLVNWGPSKNDPAKFAILGYAPEPAKKKRAAPPPPPVEDDDDEDAPF